MPIIILSEADRDTILDSLLDKALRSKRSLGEDYTGVWDRLAELFEKASDEHTIRIIVEGGCVQNVENLPMGFLYEVQDFDNCSDCGNIEPLCDWCKADG